MITQHIEEMKKEWTESEVCKRVGALESFCAVHGWGEFEGENIPQFIESSLRSLVEKIAVMAEEMEAPMETEYDLESFHEGYFTAITSFASSLREEL